MTAFQLRAQFIFDSLPMVREIFLTYAIFDLIKAQSAGFELSAALYYGIAGITLIGLKCDRSHDIPFFQIEGNVGEVCRLRPNVAHHVSIMSDPVNPVQPSARGGLEAYAPLNLIPYGVDFFPGRPFDDLNICGAQLIKHRINVLLIKGTETTIGRCGNLLLNMPLIIEADKCTSQTWTRRICSHNVGLETNCAGPVCDLLGSDGLENEVVDHILRVCTSLRQDKNLIEYPRQLTELQTGHAI